MRFKSKKGKKVLQRIIVHTLIVISVLNSILLCSSNEDIYAESTSSATARVTNFISLAAGKQTQDLLDGLSLSKDELRFLGVYISNFYIPFGTELGTSRADSNTQTKDDIVKALQTSLNFSDDMAEVFTDTVMGLSRSNCQELEFRVSSDYHSGYQSVDCMSANYFNFLRLMLGETRAVFEGYLVHEDVPTVVQDIMDGKYDYGYFGYTNNGVFIPMFDCSLTGKYYTPSQYAFYQCLASVNVDRGYGLSFFDFTEQEAKDDETLASMLKDMSDSEIYKMSAYGTTVNVDCFGNIILKGGNHQYIAVPGCMNPYTWVSVDAEGNDSYSAGTCYNMVTFQGLGLADTGNLLEPYTTVSKDSKNEGVKWVTISDDKFESNMQNVSEGFGDSINEFIPKVFDALTFFKGKKLSMMNTQYSTKGYAMRMIRGNTDTKVASKWGFGIGDSKYVDLVESAERGFKDSNSKDYSYYASVNGGFTDHSMLVETITSRVGLWGAYSKSNVKTRKDGRAGDSVRLIDNFIFIDNLGAFGFDDSNNKISYNAIQMRHYLDDSGASPNQLFSNWGKDAANGFTNMYSDIQAGKMNTTITAEDSAIVGVYTTYALSSLYIDTIDSKKSTIGFLGFRMNNDGLLSISKDPISIPSSLSEDLINKSIRDWVYYLLHPTRGADYVKTLVKTKVNAILVDWHHDMVGTRGVGATTGTTLYRGSTGYVTTPDLSEMQWTDSLLKFYEDLVPFLMVAMLVIMLFTYVLGVMPLQRCVLGLVIFSCFLLVPVNAINGVVSLSNRVTQNIYGEKFTYWALVQQESYADALDTSASGDSYNNYLKTLYATNSDVYSNQGGDSIILKWQAPKKMASLMLSNEDTSLFNSLSSSSLLRAVLNNNAYSGESYLGSESSYMYRSYTDIGNFSRYIYNGIANGVQDSRRSVSSAYLQNINSNTAKSILNMNSTYKGVRQLGYCNNNGDGSNMTSNEIRTTVPLTSTMYTDSLANLGKVSKLQLGDFVGINQNVFNFSVAMFNNSSEKYKDNIINNAPESSQEELKNYLNRYCDADLTGLAAYSLMSESPFYYFSWGLYDMGMSTGSNASNGYKSLLLGQDNGGFFYNSKGNGELKDFMDMRSLFTYIIPYLKQGNELVKEWDETFGTFIYEGVPTEEGHWNDRDIREDEILRQKYWHNLNVARLYEIYTPWVDLMYDCSYAKPETITALGKKFVISDPLDPNCYPSERPMIFSESEMHDYGLTKGDLTAVERKILNTNSGMEKRMYELLNYYNFSDLTLNTASAINCTFEFNLNFSENGIFKHNINLYPQSFEIVDFSYDAFLRFILANTTGMDIASKEDFYATLIKNSSWTTAVAMLILDVLSQYVVPAFKIFFLIGVFISSILFIIVMAFRIDPEQKFVIKLFKGVFKPMVLFLVVTIGFAWVVSLFMGVGNNAVTQSDNLSISMGDPVIVILAMQALNILCIFLYFKLLKGVFIDVKHNFKLSKEFVSGVAGGVVSGAVRGISWASSVLSSTGSSSSRKNGRGVEASTDDSFSTGRVSSRASSRASNVENVESSADNFDESRINDSHKSTFEPSKVDEQSSESDNSKKSDINEAVKRGEEKISQDRREKDEEASKTNKFKDSTSSEQTDDKVKD